MTKPVRWAGLSIAALVFTIGMVLFAPAAPAQDQAWFVT